MWPKTTKYYSPNFSLPKRPKKKIKFIILHYTGMKKESEAIRRLCDIRSKVSAHYFIKKNGEIINLVPDLYEAWHAGISNWKKIQFLNKNSIGIEIQNSGHYHNYEDFTEKQFKALKKLLKYLINLYKINLKNILGHSDISPDRKKDPGEKFPWKKLSNCGLANWHNLPESKLKKLRLVKLSQIEEKKLMKNIKEIGFRETSIIKSKQKKKFLLKAFQRKFRQSLINGKSDKECLYISKDLLK